MTKTRLWIAGGALAPLVYLAAVVAGGVLTPGYSHLAGPISALIMIGAPAAIELIPLFALYNFLLIGFAFSVRDAFAARGVRLSLLVPVLLTVIAIMGALMLVYPMDPLGEPTTETGRLHLFFAGVASLATMLALLFAARSLGRYPAWQSLALYTWVSLAAIVASGIWAATAAGAMSPLMGLAERVTIGAFLQWVLVIAVALLRAPVSGNVSPTPA